MNFFLVRGGDKNAPKIANSSGWMYGIRNDYTAYAPPKMIDICFYSYVWEEYIKTVERHAPMFALVPDYMPNDDIRDIIKKGRQLGEIVGRVGVVPKRDNIEDIPRDFIISISVPTSYAGYIPPIEKLRGRMCHLLGGSPKKQADLIKKINGVNGSIVSVDMNYHVMKAHKGQIFVGDTWEQSNDKRNYIELSIDSGVSIIEYLKTANNHAQKNLGF